MGPFPGQTKVALFTIVQWALSMPGFVAVLFVLFFYALDCLYAERKDRSILFWKSLPVSDGLTVWAKLLVALVVVPFGVFALALLAHLVYTGILGARVALGSLPPILTWNSYEWLRTEAVMFLMTLFGVLWYAPIAAYLLLVSAWARRAPMLWATLPFVLAPLLEWVAFGTRHVLDFIDYRAFGIWGILGIDHLNLISKHGPQHPVGTALEVLDFRGALTAVDLWLGLVVAVALVYAAIRIRRYRDDT
jgi:ABC-2 type transport system permease protein